MLANQCLSFLRSVYRRPCVDHEGLRNPVEQWLAGGGRYHRKTRRRISSPAEVLPCWRAGIEAAVQNPVSRDLLLFGLYTGMRRGEIMPLRWERVELGAGLFRVEETKTGVPLELPVTRQLGAILARRRADGEAMRTGWVFPSPWSESGHVDELQAHYERIGRAGGAKFWFHGLRNAFITVAERDLMLPRSLTKRLVNHAQPQDVTEGYAADWTVEQLREPAQRIADCIDELMGPYVLAAEAHAPACHLCEPDRPSPSRAATARLKVPPTTSNDAAAVESALYAILWSLRGDRFRSNRRVGARYDRRPLVAQHHDWDGIELSSVVFW